MSSQLLFKLCRESATVSSELLKCPTKSPAAVAERLYGGQTTFNKRQSSSADSDVELFLHDGDLETACQCGHWPPGETPSPLFLQAFTDALACLVSNPMSGMVSPPLMGSHGTMPLTIIAPVVDIIRHHVNLIRNAKRHLFFMTCVWTPSAAQRLIREALVDLSKAAEERGERVLVKIGIDKAGLGHFIESRQYLNPATYSSKKIGLPSPDEIPYIDLEVMSIHNMALGTMHAKFCVVDEEVATIMSNNIEDNANLEMMSQVEGPIVASILDAALLTWNKALSLQELPRKEEKTLGPDKHPRCSLETTMNKIIEANRPYQACGNQSHLHAVNQQLNLTTDTLVEATGPDVTDDQLMTPYFSTMTESPVPMALVSRPAYGALDFGNVSVPQNEAWLSLVRNAKRSIFIQTPDLNAEPLINEIIRALKRGVAVTYYVCFGYNDAGEMCPGQGGTNEQVAGKLISSLPEDGLEKSLLQIYNYVAKDQDHPIHHSFSSRSCHIKLLIADESVGVQGSGNQDTQSWYHSQEINIMVDSPEICASWRRGIEVNQNTQRFGRCLDGIWRDADGSPGRGYSGDPGLVSGLFKGIAGMTKKAFHQSRGAKDTGN